MKRFPEYTYSIGNIWKEDRWILITDENNTGWYRDMMSFWEYEGPIEFLNRIIDRYGWSIEETGIQEYVFREDPLQLKFAFDDLFGFTVQYKSSKDLPSVMAFLQPFVV